MTFAVAREEHHLKIPIGTQPDSFSAPKSKIDRLGVSQVTLHISGCLFGVENPKWPVSIVASLEECFRIFDNGSISVSATKVRVGSEPFNTGVATAMVGIGMGVDHKAQVSRLDSKICQTRPDQVVEMCFAASV